MKQLMHIIK